MPELDPAAAREAIEFAYEQGWSDGLPLVPPTEAHLAEFLARTSRQPEEVLATAEHLGMSCTVAQAAMNAIMAGCRPEYFPVVLAAVEALWGERGFNPMLASTTGPAPLLVVNGPVRNEIGLNCAGNVFGPGFRPNATIGRTIRLLVLNVFGLKPHELDQACQSTPAKYTCCFGENEEQSAWPSLAADRGFAADASTVTGFMARSTCHVENRTSADPEHVLMTIADAMSYGGAHVSLGHSAVLVVMGPEHAELLASRGWSKERVRQFLFEHCGRRLGELRRMGKGEFEELIGTPGEYRLVDESHRPMPGAATLPDDHFVRFCGATDDILLVVAGANNAGVSTVVPGLGTREGPPFPIAPVRP
ncbi:MAG TPA: hypothetical protein VFS62_00600 [Chloroflexota bacterium]|nr:hypothetical protein [Chloroflexota bacterium]